MKLDIKEIGKGAMPVLGLVLMVASTVVNNKNSDSKMAKLIDKKVSEAIANKTNE